MVQVQEDLPKAVQWMDVYCTISVNSAEHVTNYTPAEMKISAPRRNDRYHPFFSAVLEKKFTIF